MRIFYITPQFPSPLDTGGKIKAYSTIKALLNMSEEIYLFSFFENSQDKICETELKKIGVKKIITVYNPKVKTSTKIKLINILRSFGTLKPYTTLRYYNKTLCEEIKKSIGIYHPDILWIQATSMIQYLPKNFNGLKIFESYDIDSLLYKSVFKKSYFFHLKLLGFIEWLKYSIYEKVFLKKFDIIFAISRNDKKNLQKITNRKDIIVLPTAVEPKKIYNRSKIHGRILFVGNLTWYPNKDAVMWFIKQVFPLIIRKIPAIEFWIVGKYSESFDGLKGTGIKFMGYVENLSWYFNSANVFVAPFLYGTGIRTKILDAMSYGLPVVTTPEGASGLDLTDGKEVIIGKDEKEFAKKTIELLKNKTLQKKIIRNAYRFLKANYSFKNLTDSLSILSKYPIHE